MLPIFLTSNFTRLSDGYKLVIETHLAIVVRVVLRHCQGDVRVGVSK